MRLRHGCTQDAEKIASIYLAAFADSMDFFFPKKEQGRLLSLLTKSFTLTLLWGGQVILVDDAKGVTLGYCIYQSNDRLNCQGFIRRLLTSLQIMIRIVPNIWPREALKLGINQLMMKVWTKYDRRPPKYDSHIVSVGVLPQRQGGGVGTRLLNAALSELARKNVFLNVRSHNKAARKLYEGMGFGYYGATKDLRGQWLKMVKKGI